MRIGKLTVERRTNVQMRAIRQGQIDRMRKGGFRKSAAKAQGKLNRKGW